MKKCDGGINAVGVDDRIIWSWFVVTGLEIGHFCVDVGFCGWF